jgi:hypothetical protein
VLAYQRGWYEKMKMPRNSKMIAILEMLNKGFNRRGYCYVKIPNGEENEKKILFHAKNLTKEHFCGPALANSFLIVIKFRQRLL